MKYLILSLLFFFTFSSYSMNNTLNNDTVQSSSIVWEKATFSGGCFWCMEHPFEELSGVQSVLAGYTGGNDIDPTYKEVSEGSTGHAEAIQITFNPQKTTYKELLDIFWKQIDPTDANGQFVDRGSQYRSGIFYHNEKQKQSAETSKKELENKGVFKKQILTEIIKASSFYPAEEYHQDYYKKNPIRYAVYRKGSGRDEYLEKTWKQDITPTTEKKLTELQYKITKQNGTEPAFDNEYWDNKKEGIYVDISSGEVLFSSKDKFTSGTGWPSFTRPLESKNIILKKDTSLFVERTEVRSLEADSHLGHLFLDGPEPSGLRYCINSASLLFIPKESLEEKGYGTYMNIFD